MKCEDKDSLDETFHQSSIVRDEHDDLLTQRSEILKASLCGNARTQSISADILDAVEEFVGFGDELVTISRSLYFTASLAQEGGDTFDLSHEVFGCSEHLLDVVQRTDESLQNILDAVRELFDRRGGGHEQG